MNTPKIALLMMLKNEEKRLPITLASVLSYIDLIIVYDTGSTDSTIDILTFFSRRHNIPMFLKKGVFEDFSTSRNVSLTYADEVCDRDPFDYILLFDCNDELKNGDSLRRFALQHRDDDLSDPLNTAWLMKQTWYAGCDSSYFNVRLIRPRQQWFFKGVVHEFIEKLNAQCYVTNQVPDCVLYQDRTLDDDKSGKRFFRDKVLLLEEYRKTPSDPRTVFYLAQTYSCLDMLQEAYFFYEIRTRMTGFQEETFHSYLRMGMIVGKLFPQRNNLPAVEIKDMTVPINISWDTAAACFLNAFEVCQRVEPLIYLIEHYRHKEEYLMAYTFAKLAISLPATECILFVESDMYEYSRWHLMGIVAFYAYKKLNSSDENILLDGWRSCIEAIKARNYDIDIQNIKFYEESLHIKKDEVLF